MSARCAQFKIAPIAAHDLVRLLEYTVEYGAISMLTLPAMFSIHHLDEISAWVSSFEEELRRSRSLAIDVLIRALERLGGRIGCERIPLMPAAALRGDHLSFPGAHPDRRTHTGL